MRGKHILMFVTLSTVQDCCNKLRHEIADLVQASVQQQQQQHKTRCKQSHTDRQQSQWNTVPYKEALFAVTPLIISRVTGSCRYKQRSVGGVASGWLAGCLHVRHSTAQHSTEQHSTTQHRTTQHSTEQHSTTQHSTAQHNTAQNRTAQHSA